MSDIPCLIFVALRSTGPDPQRDRLLQITASSLNPTGIAKRFNSFVNPGANMITPRLEMGLGLDVGQLGQMVPFATVIQSFFRFCDAMRGTRTVVLVGHNAHHFQWPLLTHEMRRARVEVPGHYDLWDSLHAIRPYYETRRLSSCRPAEILHSWERPVQFQGPVSDIQSIIAVLEVLSRLGKTQPPFDPLAIRIYRLLRQANETYIQVQKQNASNQFETRRLRVNATKPVPDAKPLDTVKYDPDFIPDLISEPEPAPVPKGIVVYEKACKWIDAFYPEKTKEVLGFLELLQKRYNYGKKKYSQPLMTDDGRDDIEDALQELGDLFVYTFKARLNSHDTAPIRAYVGILQSLLDDQALPETKKLKVIDIDDVQTPEPKIEPETNDESVGDPTP